MTKNWKVGLSSALLSISLLAAGAASVPAQAQTAVPMPQPTRKEWGSNHSITHVRQRLEKVIDNLQRDQHDYGGHRAQALNYLYQARQQLLSAEQWESAHPGQ